MIRAATGPLYEAPARNYLEQMTMECSLRIESSTDALFEIWVDEPLASPHDQHARLYETVKDGKELYKAIVRCMLHVRAQGGAVCYIDLPRNGQVGHRLPLTS